MGNTVYIFLEQVIIVLKELGAKFEVLWISFEIFIPDATSEVISRLVNIGIVAKIRHDQVIPHISPQPPRSQPPPQGNETWNIGLMNARCKDIKCLAEGVILGFIDVRYLCINF